MSTTIDTMQDLTTAQVMVDQKSTFMPDGLSEAGVTMSDMDRGYTAETLGDEGRCDADGTNYVGTPYARGGGFIGDSDTPWTRI